MLLESLLPVFAERLKPEIDNGIVTASENQLKVLNRAKQQLAEGNPEVVELILKDWEVVKDAESRSFWERFWWVMPIIGFAGVILISFFLWYLYRPEASGGSG